jgi:hypothetical protein
LGVSVADGEDHVAADDGVEERLWSVIDWCHVEGKQLGLCGRIDEGEGAVAVRRAIPDRVALVDQPPSTRQVGLGILGAFVGEDIASPTAGSPGPARS